MDKLLVSVIIPAFNRIDFIHETVGSVLEQDYSEIELIVVDDGSTDGTYEALQRYAIEGKITLLSHENRANRGQSASINVGLKQAKGDFVAILDSDDLFAVGKLTRQVEFLNAHPDVGLVYGSGFAIDAAGNRLYQIHGESHTEPNDPNLVLLDCYFLLPQNSLVRRSVYEKVGFFAEDLRAAQDHDMLIRMAEVTKFAYIPDLVFYYRRHGDSISAKGQERRWRNGFEILRRARQRYPYKRCTIRKRLAVLNFRMGQEFWRRGTKLKAVPYLLKSACLDPVRAVAEVMRGGRLL